MTVHLLLPPCCGRSFLFGHCASHSSLAGLGPVCSFVEEAVVLQTCTIMSNFYVGSRDPNLGGQAAVTKASSYSVVFPVKGFGLFCFPFKVVSEPSGLCRSGVFGS